MDERCLMSFSTKAAKTHISSKIPSLKLCPEMATCFSSRHAGLLIISLIPLFVLLNWNYFQCSMQVCTSLKHKANLIKVGLVSHDKVDKVS